VELSVKSPGPSCPGGVSLACKCSSLSTELELVRMVICLGAQVEQVHRELLCCELRGTFAEGSQRIQIYISLHIQGKSHRRIFLAPFIMN
jgi:hypothetical protein